jgi:Hemerythrin HHE cation binding domain
MTIATIGAPGVWAFTEHEHRDLIRGINRIHDVACEIGRRPAFELSAHVLGVLGWLDNALAPHIRWEDGWLYPQIDTLTRTPWATRAARFEHEQIREAATKLRMDAQALGMADGLDVQADVRCHLFGLEALLRAHMEREERFLIPLLNEDGGALDT